MFHFHFPTDYGILSVDLGYRARTTYHSNFVISLPNGMRIAMDGGSFEPHLNERLAAQGVYGRVVYAEPGQWVAFSVNAGTV